MLLVQKIEQTKRQVNLLRKVKFDYSALKGKIIEKYGSQSSFAKVLGVSERTLSLKLNNIVAFSQDEMLRSILLLGSTSDDIKLYFFNTLVQETELKTD